MPQRCKSDSPDGRDTVVWCTTVSASAQHDFFILFFLYCSPVIHSKVGKTLSSHVFHKANLKYMTHTNKYYTFIKFC